LTLPRRSLFGLAFVSGALFLSGCLATRQEIEDLRGDIVRLQAALTKVQTGQSGLQTDLQGSQADLMSQMNDLSRNLEILSAHLQESESRMSLMASRMDDLDKNLSNRLDLLADMMSGSKLAAPPSPSTLYNLAYSDFSRRRYEPALKGFQTYLEKYGDTEKAADAQFYIGEAHFAQEQWARAVDAYDKVLVNFSTSTVVPAAYVQKGQALEKMGKTSEAVAVYDAVVRKYPYRREATTARARLDALKEPPVAEPPPQ
jgi:tol-pal system protein YbgF